jgi:hypothetical protein
LHYLRVGGRGFCLEAGKTRSQPVLVLAQGKMLVNRAESLQRPVRALLAHVSCGQYTLI